VKWFGHKVSQQQHWSRLVWNESCEEGLVGIIVADLSFLRNDVHCDVKYIPLLNLWTFVIECRHDGTNVVSLTSGNISSVGKVCAAYREADEAELGNRNLCGK
jgi:hypothetical protein